MYLDGSYNSVHKNLFNIEECNNKCAYCKLTFSAGPTSTYIFIIILDLIFRIRR